MTGHARQDVVQLVRHDPAHRPAIGNRPGPSAKRLPAASLGAGHPTGRRSPVRTPLPCGLEEQSAPSGLYMGRESLGRQVPGFARTRRNLQSHYTDTGGAPIRPRSRGRCKGSVIAVIQTFVLSLRAFRPHTDAMRVRDALSCGSSLLGFGCVPAMVAGSPPE